MRNEYRYQSDMPLFKCVALVGEGGRRALVLMINQQSFMWTSIFIHFVAFSLASHEQTCKLSIFTCDIIVHVFAPLKSSRQTARIELNEGPLSSLKIKQP